MKHVSLKLFPVLIKSAWTSDGPQAIPGPRTLVTRFTKLFINLLLVIIIICVFFARKDLRKL